MKKVVEVKNVSKKFTKTLKRSLLYGTFDTLRNFIGYPSNQAKLRKSEFWALKDISFELDQGEILGIIGANGSGKSTLLRVLNGIFPPDKGEIKIDGKIGGLIAVGAGFHPHMTGRENIYLNGTILGMGRKEIDLKFDQIVKFAEIGDFLDAPVSTYSSGMKVKLGFAIAIHVDPEILLIDEVLSVGDLSFRNKSLRFMAKLRQKAKAIIFISHNLEQVRNLCTRVIVLDEGKIVFEGDTNEGCAFYENLSTIKRLTTTQNEDEDIIIKDEKFDKRISAGEGVEIVEIGILNSKNHKSNNIKMGEEFAIYCDFKNLVSGINLYFSFSILSEKRDLVVWSVSNDFNKYTFNNLEKATYRSTMKISNNVLNPGIYIPNIAIRNEQSGETYERIVSKEAFIIESDGQTLQRGVLHFNPIWNIEKK